MSAPRNKIPNDSFEKVYVARRLNDLAIKGHRRFKSSDELYTYLTREMDLDRPCTEWVNNAPMPTIRELLQDHQRLFDQRNPDASQAPNGGPAAYGNYPSPVSERVFHPASSSQTGRRQPSTTYDHVCSQGDVFDAWLVQVAAPDNEPILVLARTDPERNNSVVDIMVARELCGDRVIEGDSVSVILRQDGQDTPIQCVVGQSPDGVNIVFGRNASVPGPCSEAPSERGLPSFDEEEFKRKRAEQLVLLAEEATKRDMQRAQKRPPDDDNGSQRPTQRFKR